ncbi:cupin-like domain-containing protein [Sphingomonas aracearum]|uniref:Cupin-like domain-containing protein n=1 Tax=Sphingomonas aracearum TaxID=2283317 RepID=A0A369VX01_9SPHN|nr:cupin-like domain-containing protein [Sphingomonas aracearum]RDE05690.1 cupin-like domain-containing protein [Sphingomonas aracearum]
MTAVPRPVRRLEGLSPERLPFAELVAAGEPVILTGVVRDWPMVAAGARSADEAVAYLKGFYRGQLVVGSTAPPEAGGRYFYDHTLTRLNFEPARVALDAYLDRILDYRDDPAPPSFYVGSTDLDTYLPGFRAANDLALGDPMFDPDRLLVSIWIGNRTIASTHYDMTNNIACCLVGHRRFTLFPPEQVRNLYPGPLEPTPGGQVVSLVDLRAPDMDRFPRFAEAMESARVAELEPGDALFYPAMWWHNVEALDAFNVMVNYWWNEAPAFMDTPMNTLLHGLLSLRDRPMSEKQAWRALFDFYLFGPAEQAAAHLPPEARGPLAPLDRVAARRLRALLQHRLNR